MPPPDTIQITIQNRVPGNPLPDTLVILPSGDTVSVPANFYGTGGYKVWKVQQEIYRKQNEEWKNKDTSGSTYFILIAIFLIIAYGARSTEGRVVRERKRKRRTTVTKEKAEKGVLYDNWLSKYNPYYKSLSQAGKDRFLSRTIEFILSKEFHFHSIREEEIMPVLISGAAVQITYGLKNFRMDYYPIINVIRKEYVLKMDQETYFGHVSKSGIYISWKHFNDGYEDYSDSINIGLHEMAHALSFDAYLGYADASDRKFKQRLKEFSEEGVPVFRALKKFSNYVLDDYASTNFDEFWAVSVETFFEEPEKFKQNLPDLYKDMCDTLNQDPLLPGKIIDSNIACTES